MTIELDLPTDKIKGVIKGAAGHIIFNNPERHNAVSLEMWDAVEVALNAFMENDDVRIVILSGAGVRPLFRVRIFQNLKKSADQRTQPNTIMRALRSSMIPLKTIQNPRWQ